MSASLSPCPRSVIVTRLRAAGCVFAEDEARLLISAARTRADLAAMVDRRAAGLPLEHVLGWAEFCGLRIAVDPGVFVPRRRTEFLVRQAAALARARPVVVDLCCGSGAVGGVLVSALDRVELYAVDVEERMYAAGRIPGSFFRREGRPSEDAILTCRLIDRPLRPSFAKGLRNEIQVVCTILALDPDTLYDVVAINAASASTMLAGLPFSGPIGATRMGYVDGAWVAFPTHAELERATFDMVVAGRVLDGADGPATGDVAIMMVEAEAPPGTVALVTGGAAAP